MSSTITQTLLGLPAPLEHNSVDLSLEVDSDSNGPVAMGLAGADGPIAPSARPETGNIFYVNTIPDIPEAGTSLANAQKDTELSSSFWFQKGIDAVDMQVKNNKLSNSNDGDKVIEKSNYLTRVLEYAMMHSAWVSLNASQNAAKDFTVAKDQLHPDLLKTVLGGLNLSDESLAKFETVLKSIADTIANTKKSSAKQNIWVLLTTYRWDPVQKRIFAGMRTIYFNVTQELQDWTTSGKHGTSGTDAKITLLYKMDDYSFNSSVWDNFKAQVKAFVDEKGSQGIITPISLDV